MIPCFSAMHFGVTWQSNGRALCQTCASWLVFRVVNRFVARNGVYAGVVDLRRVSLRRFCLCAGQAIVCINEVKSAVCWAESQLSKIARKWCFRKVRLGRSGVEARLEDSKPGSQEITGGGGGIRTLVTGVAGKTVFETAAFNHSATPPHGAWRSLQAACCPPFGPRVSANARI